MASEVNQVCRLYVVRPGPTADNVIENNTDKPVLGRWSDSDKTALAPEGLASADKAKEAFKDVVFDGAYCSYAERTFETAEIVLNGRKVEVKPRKKFYEMRIGETAGKTPDEIKSWFHEQTGYPENPSTKEKFPKLWAKRQGKPAEPNDCFLDKWRDDMDTFDEFSEAFITRLKNLAAKSLGQTLLVVPHGTPMKAIIAEAKGITSDRVICGKGSFYAVTIDANGKFSLIEDKLSGISIEV